MSLRRIALLASLLLAAACTRLTAENYDKLRMGMSYAEVKALLGDPERCSDVLGAKRCVWGDDQKHISVNFVSDRAILFSAENIR
jgi:hypothetical protein